MLQVIVQNQLSKDFCLKSSRIMNKPKIIYASFFDQTKNVIESVLGLNEPYFVIKQQVNKKKNKNRQAFITFFLPLRSEPKFDKRRSLEHFSLVESSNVELKLQSLNFNIQHSRTSNSKFHILRNVPSNFPMHRAFRSVFVNKS